MPKIARILSLALAIVAGTIGAAKLIGYIVGIPVRLETILFGIELQELAARIPNQMAPNTALNFVALGLAVCLLDARPRRFPVCNILALVSTATALLALVGYAYGVTQFTRVSAFFIPMALHTAITFVVLSLGILFARSDAPLPQIFSSEGLARLVAVRLFPVATVVVFCLGWLRLYGERRGYFPGAVGTALLVVVIIFIFVALTWWTASSLDRLERLRRAAENEAKQGRAELEVSLKNLQLVMNHAAELICSLDRYARFLSINEACVELLGLMPRQIVGRTMKEFLHPDHHAEWDGAYRQTTSGIANATVTLRFRRRDESFVPVAWSFQGSAHHRRIFAVGRVYATRESLRPWQHVT